MKILIAEDEELIRMALKKHISGYEPAFDEILESGDGLQAEADILRYRPDVVLIDIRMPGRDGLQVIRNTCKRTDARFIIISGFNEFTYAQEAIRLGVSAYLLKPIKRVELYQVLTDAIGKLKTQRQIQTELSEREQWEQLHQRRELAFRAIINMDVPAEQLQSVFQMPYYMAAIYETAEICENLRDMLQKILSKEADCTVLQRGSKRYVLLLGRRSPEIAGFRQTAAMGLRIAEQTCPRCTGALGTVSVGCSTLHGSYEAAEQRLLERIVRGNGHLLEEPERPGPEAEQAAGPMVSSICKAVMSGDTLGVHRLVEQLIAFLRLEKTDYQMLKRINGELLVTLRRLQRQLAPDAQTPDWDLRDCLGLEAVQTLLEEKLDAMAKQMQHSPAEQGVERAVLFLQENLDKPVTLEQAASLIGLHPNYFSKCFKKQTGQNFIDYLTALRMEKARTLLRECPKLSVAKVGVLCGYQNTRYFSSLFKSTWGMKPSEFRTAEKETP